MSFNTYYLSRACDCDVTQQIAYVRVAAITITGHIFCPNDTTYFRSQDRSDAQPRAAEDANV